jgi:hypothetical protein
MAKLMSHAVCQMDSLHGIRMHAVKLRHMQKGVRRGTDLVDGPENGAARGRMARAQNNYSAPRESNSVTL